VASRCRQGSVCPCTHARPHPYIRPILVCVCVCVRVCVRACVSACVRVRVLHNEHMHMYSYENLSRTRTHMHMCACACMNTYVCVCVFYITSICICIHTCISGGSLGADACRRRRQSRGATKRSPQQQSPQGVTAAAGLVLYPLHRTHSFHSRYLLHKI
jgi:hypothetical protein